MSKHPPFVQITASPATLDGSVVLYALDRAGRVWIHKTATEPQNSSWVRLTDRRARV